MRQVFMTRTVYWTLFARKFGEMWYWLLPDAIRLRLVGTSRWIDTKRIDDRLMTCGPVGIPTHVWNKGLYVF